MALDTSNRSFVNRDLSPVFVLLGGTLAIASFLLCIFYFWSPIRERAVRLQLNELRPVLKESRPELNEFNFDKRYAGEIITGSVDEDKCRKLVFDNRNGNMWDKGPVRCDDTVLQFLGTSQQEAGRVSRLHEISKAFR